MDATERLSPSDLSDEEWTLLEPLLPEPSTQGRRPKWPQRLIADAVFYLLRTGCTGRALPREYPPWPTVYWHFVRWRQRGANSDEPTTSSEPVFSEPAFALVRGVRRARARPSSTASR